MRAAALLLAALAAGPARAADPPPGALSCSGCHALGGKTAIPAIYGRDAGELAATLEAFRTGARPATLMNRIVKGFTPAEVQAIASWLSQQYPS